VLRRQVWAAFRLGAHASRNQPNAARRCAGRSPARFDGRYAAALVSGVECLRRSRRYKVSELLRQSLLRCFKSLLIDNMRHSLVLEMN
jgi:hypothetical protein